MRADVTGCWLGALLGGMLLLHAANVVAASFMAAPGDDLRGIVATMQDGDELTLAPGSYVGGIFIEGLSVAILGPASGEAIITAPDGTNVLIGVLGGGGARLERLSFAPSDTAPFGLYVQNSTASCDSCVFANTPGTPIYSESSTLTLTGGRIETVAGDGIVAVQRSTLTVEGVAIAGVTGTAIVAADAVSANLVDLDIEGGGVLITGGTGSSRIERNRIVAPAQANALQLQVTGEVTVADNRFEAADTGMLALLNGTASLTIRGTTAIGPNGALYVEAVTGSSPSISIEDNVLLATGGDASALRLFGVPSAIVAGNVMLASGVGVFLGQGANASLSANIIVASNFGVGTPESTPGSATLNEEVIVAATPLSAGLAADNGTMRLLNAIGADSALADGIKADLATVLAAESLADEAALARIADAASALRDAAGALATVRLLLTDAAGREEPTAFVVLDSAETIIAESTDGATLAVEPGSYRIAPSFDLNMTTAAEIAEGDSQEVQLALPRSLWVPLTYSNATDPHLLLFRALPQQEAQRLAASDGYDWRLETIRAFPRSEATPDDIARALELARAAVARLPSVPTDQIDELWDKTSPERIEARRILAVYGDGSDAQLLLDSVIGIWGDNQSGAAAAAYLEARLGRLSDGAVRATMDSTDPEKAFAAAAALRMLGLPAAADRLLSWIGNPEIEMQGEIIYLLRGVDDAALSEVHRKRLADFIAGQQGEKPPFFPLESLPHLIAFGGADDWRLMGEAVNFIVPDSNRQVAERLALYAIDPLEFTDVLASFVAEDRVLVQVQICPKLRARGAEQFAKINQAMQDQSNGWWRFVNNSQNTYVQYYLEAGGCWPNEESAHYYHTGESELAGKYYALPWMPEPWYEQELLANEAKGTINSRYFDHVGFFGYEDLAAASAALSEATTLTDPDLRLAYRTVLSRAGYYERLHTFEDGLERRPYLLRHANAPDYSGALSGMVIVDPQLGEHGELVIRMRIEQIPYYHGCCDLASTMANNNNLSAWLHSPYLEDGGSALVKSIRLTRHGVEVPVTLTGPHARGFRIAAGPSPEGLVGLVLTVELELFGDRRTLVYDLFASARARGFGPN
ncbi:MAG: right-handed parallel beta-helix repeat-containing protein [Devosia sp.]